MLKQLIIQQVQGILSNGKPSSGKPSKDFLYPPGDPGLFGPESVIWRVHGDFTSMMIGGISSLILQALHPLALAGVWDHSSFRQDLKGRLGRTALFIAVTTYGNTLMAEQAITRVKRIHDSLAGTHPDGRAYRVSDPHLLYWVHLTEAYSFLNAHRLYVNPHLPITDQDQYFSEMQKISEGLGCRIVDSDGINCFAKTKTQVEDALQSYFPELIYSDRSEWVTELLENYPSEPTTHIFNRLIIKAGFYNLPHWAYPLMGRKAPSDVERQLVNQAINVIAKPVRWALSGGVHAQAQKRMGIYR